MTRMTLRNRESCMPETTTTTTLYRSTVVLFSDGARCEVYENGGVERLATLLTAQLTTERDSSKTLARIACGFLFNLVNTHGLSAFCHLVLW